MKENPRKEAQGREGQQNQLKRGQSKGTRQLPAKKQSQELKGMEKQSIFGFKKKERPARGRPKLTFNEHKAHCQTAHLPQQDPLQKEAPKAHSFPEKLQSIDRYTGKQQCEKNKQIQKRKNGHRPVVDNTSSPPSKAENQLQPKSKREAKELKKVQKMKIESFQPKEQFSEEGTSNKKELQEHFPEELLSIFRQKYPYYLVGDRIIFPVEDTLLDTYPELLLDQESRSEPENIAQPLPKTFEKELQIWNMLVENASFFKLDEQIRISSIRKIFGNGGGQTCQRLWKQFNRFYLNDILYHHYDESSNEEYFSFISLWRYTDENNFLDRLFQTCWNKFLYFYIRLVKPHYSNQTITQQLGSFQDLIGANLERGQFNLPASYEQMLDYLILLVNMSFETHTFKTLINGKMVFFRDNNKMKNELLQQKKNHENCLWQLKDNEKSIVKKEKLSRKALKKEVKGANSDRLQELQKEIEELTEARETIQARRDFFNQKITDIDNKIYQLCCLPEFSNVWLLGEDRHHNLYWFVREQQSVIYREERNTGEWRAVRGDNIERLHKSLQCKGIRERKLYEKILYYKQLGYIKTSTSSVMEIEQDQKQLKVEHTQREDKEGELWTVGTVEPQQIVCDASEFDKFQYGEYRLATPHVVKLMILKSEWMMTKYLFERNSKWTSEELRQQYPQISRMSKANLSDGLIYFDLTADLRAFNEKICVVEINIKLRNQSDQIEVKTRKIQTKIWGINEKYKHFWYDYSRKCKSLSDLHFLVSVLYLTIERYVTKTRKPNNTKYFFKTVEFGQQQQICEACQAVGDLQSCPDCEFLFHGDCLAKHGGECPRRLRQVEDFVEFGLPSDLNS